MSSGNWVREEDLLAGDPIEYFREQLAGRRDPTLALSKYDVSTPVGYRSAAAWLHRWVADQNPGMDRHHVGLTVYHQLGIPVPNINRVNALVSVFPELKQEAACPECGWTQSLDNIIIDLNDTHKWDREKIADWVESGVTKNPHP